MFLIKGTTTQVLNLNRLNKIVVSPTIIQIKCFSAADIGKRYPKTFDYKNKFYGAFAQLYETSSKRLSDNSLIITVDGNFGSGKSEFAKKLAKEIDFIYASEIDLDKMYYTRKDNGANIREITNSFVGNNEKYRINTIEEWHEDPMFKRSIQLQHGYYYCRWWQYRTALLHLFSTGQGVVLERSPFSDNVIAQSLYEENLLSKEAYNFYKNDLVKQTLLELWKPHITIYLDRNSENCLKSIQKNGTNAEKNSKVYSADFLKTVEKNYKKSFLPQTEKDSYVLNYDNNGEMVGMDEVIGDLENCDLDDRAKFSDWVVRRAQSVDLYRRQ
jgi:NADH dehydrogenase (ubiquinone) 1 alpha subcomplex subunit 10